MKSNKQRKAELKAKKQAKAQKQLEPPPSPFANLPKKKAWVNHDKLVSGGLSVMDFQERGYYLDKEFTCQECGRIELWRATQQKWWYEVAQGHVKSTAKLCRACRMKNNKRKADARRVHLEGVAKKKKADSTKRK